MPSVSNSPTLIAQETPSWCFAAAEVMVRQYYGLQQMSQYEIARASTAALAEADLSLAEKWDLAQVLDSSADVTEDVGENHKSKIVELVRGQWNAFNHDATGGQFIAKPTWEDVRAEIDNDRVFVVGSTIHYYVVSGYSDDGKGRRLWVQDPWPAGRGGQKSFLLFDEFLDAEGKACIVFRQ
ncbi:hypothetical protein C6558_13755 [Ensifer sp. NM-2]|uniref:C39 family peptidase n=1 Tax=Ensifer sp. NM-2 TaxID=2109730 RepID=UPI000D11D056|nr:papain-like cysteine protease family protein [Ensifer sp. NM-2]PSS64534.1 hypothetical protein C6558_13755 [Ensifer sp. NM-2]